MAVSEHTTTLPVSRRRLLAGAGVTVAAAVAFTAPGIVHAAVNPDADLLVAWDAFVRAHHSFSLACETLPGGGTDEDHEPYYAEIERWEDVIERAKATTVAGFSVQLKYLFAHRRMTMETHNVVVCGQPITEQFKAEVEALEPMDKLLWNMIQASSVVGGVA